MTPQLQQTKSLETVFFSTLDALRGVWDATNASSVLLSLVFYKRILALVEEGQFPDVQPTEQELNWSQQFRTQILEDSALAHQQLLDTLHGFAERHADFKGIFAPFKRALEQESNTELLIQLILVLENIDFSSQAISVQNFGTFFNDSLYRTALRAGKSGIRRTTPKNINRLMASLANPQAGERVYDPSAGQGSTLIELLDLETNLSFCAHERSYYVWALCKMNLLMNGQLEAQLINSNPLLEAPDADTIPLVDIAIAHFPFGQNLASEQVKQQPYLTIPFDINIPQIGGTSLFIQLLLSRLNHTGRLLTILPIQALVSDREDRKFREFLLRRDWLEAVISLPYGLLYTTGVPICILIANKQKAACRKEKVLFINGANLDVKTPMRINRELPNRHIEEIIKAFQAENLDNAAELSDYVATISTQKIIEYDYNLDAKRYASPFIAQLKQLAKSGQLIQLKEIFKTERPALWFDETPHQDIPYIRPHNLGTSITNYLISPKHLPSTNQVKQVAGQLINESVLLVNRSGKRLRVSYFTYEQQPILVNEDIMTFRINEDQILIEYLLLQLHGSLFVQQLNMYKTDYQHKMISEEQFEALQINLPPIEAQALAIKETKIRLLQEEEQKVERLRNDLNLGKQKAQNEQYKIISSLQHELGNRLPAVLTEFKNLKDFLKEKEQDESSIDFSEPIFPVFEGEDPAGIDQLDTVVERIESILVHCINSLDSTGDIIKADRTKLKLERVLLKHFLEEISQLYTNEKAFRIQIVVEEDEAGNELPIYAQIDRTQFTTVITNLIDNAKRHGFDKQNKTYTIEFQIGLSSDQQEAILLYKNDGEAFPDNFSFEDFIGYGKYAGQTGHSGIGGYLIHQIIDNHDGHIEYRKQVDHRDPFRVQFEITLPAV